VLWVVAGLLVVAAVSVGIAAAALPGCSSCHDSADFVAQTDASSHAEIDCVRCHVEPGVVARTTYGFNLVFGMALGLAPASAGPTTAIADKTCLSCHSAVLREKVTANGLSILHSQCAEGRPCTDCHADTAHGSTVKWITTVNMNQCLDCHAAERVRSECDTCHGEKSAQDRIDSGEWSITHNASWRQTHGMGDLQTCRACHPDDYCVRCHGMRLPHDASFIRTHPLRAQEQRKDCVVCHRQTFCDSCHGMRMPHPASFTPQHSRLVNERGRAACERCHVGDDCVNCHERHVHPGGAKSPPGSDAR